MSLTFMRKYPIKSYKHSYFFKIKKMMVAWRDKPIAFKAWKAEPFRIPNMCIVLL